MTKLEAHHLGGAEQARGREKFAVAELTNRIGEIGGISKSGRPVEVSVNNVLRIINWITRVSFRERQS
jgi:hypothetical protein